MINVRSDSSPGSWPCNLGLLCLRRGRLSEIIHEIVGLSLALIEELESSDMQCSVA
jgi:hypothetical protein